MPSIYDDWTLPLRQQYHQEVRQALERLIASLENQRAYEEGIRYAQRLLDLDPLDEAPYRYLMRLRAFKGDRSGVLRVYRECVKVLQEELGVGPSPETQEVYSRVVDLLPASRTAPSAATETLPLVGRTQEWTSLQAAWQRTLQGHAQLVAVTGEAGIGKAQLAEELLQHAAYSGAVTARTRS